MYKTIILITVTIGLAQGRAVNQAGLDLIKSFEGFRANFYTDASGHKTIGYGHNCDAHPDCGSIKAPITEAQGQAILASDLTSYEACVNGKVPAVNDNQFAALVSFTFNEGCGSFEGSTLCKDCIAKDYTAAAEQFGQWTKAGGKVLEGLVKRRAAEKALFLKPVTSPTPAPTAAPTVKTTVAPTVKPSSVTPPPGT